MTSITGGCACGAIRYEITGAPIFQAACHCRTCQYTSGGSPTLIIAFPSAALTVTKGEARTYWSDGDSGGRVGRSFCEVCGTPLFAAPEAMSGMINVKVGSLDDPSAFAPQVIIYTKDAQPWHHMAEGIPTFATAPGAA